MQILATARATIDYSQWNSCDSFSYGLKSMRVEPITREGSAEAQTIAYIS